MNVKESLVIRRDHYSCRCGSGTPAIRAWPCGGILASAWLWAAGSGERLGRVRLESAQRQLCAAFACSPAISALVGSSVRPPHRHGRPSVFSQALIKISLRRIWEFLILYPCLYLLLEDLVPLRFVLQVLCKSLLSFLCTGGGERSFQELPVVLMCS